MNHADVLGVAPDADLATIKAAYRAKLKEFPAHSHPEEFKAVRAAYEALRKPGAQTSAAEDEKLMEPKALGVTVDAELIRALRQRVMAEVEKPLEDLIKLSF